MASGLVGSTPTCGTAKMEHDPKNYYKYSGSNLELALRSEVKNIRNTRSLLRSYGIDRATINILIKAKFRGAQEIYDATDQTLNSIEGIGRKRLSKIRRSLLPYYIRAL